MKQKSDQPDLDADMTFEELEARLVASVYDENLKEKIRAILAGQNVNN